MVLIDLELGARKGGPNKHFCKFQTITCVQVYEMSEIIPQVSIP